MDLAKVALCRYSTESEASPARSGPEPLQLVIVQQMARRGKILKLKGRVVGSASISSAFNTANLVPMQQKLDGASVTSLRLLRLERATADLDV